MSTDDFVIAVGFAAFLVFLIFSQRRDRQTIPKRDAGLAVAEAVVRATVDPPSVVIDRPSHKGKR